MTILERYITVLDLIIPDLQKLLEVREAEIDVLKGQIQDSGDIVKVKQRWNN